MCEVGRRHFCYGRVMLAVSHSRAHMVFAGVLVACSFESFSTGTDGGDAETTTATGEQGSASSNAEGESGAPSEQGSSVASTTSGDPPESSTTDEPSDSSAGSTTATGGDRRTDLGAELTCPREGDLGPGDHAVEIDHAGTMRNYKLHVPSNYDPHAPTVLFINMHGLYSNPDQQTEFSATNQASDAQGFVVAYPQGQDNSWNGGTCCGSAAANMVDDVAFLEDVVADISKQLCIDPRRVYATGMSNGGYMSHRLGCEANDVFAGIAPVAGAMGISDCTPERPVPVIAFHGVQDTYVVYSAGEAAIQEWIGHNGCTGDPVRSDFGGSHCDRWESCDEDVQVEFCTLDPMGHCWPDGSETFCSLVPGNGIYNADIDANARMWEFLIRFTLPFK